jgi:hypothetical protein
MKVSLVLMAHAVGVFCGGNANRVAGRAEYTVQSGRGQRRFDGTEIGGDRDVTPLLKIAHGTQAYTGAFGQIDL